MAFHRTMVLLGWLTFVACLLLPVAWAADPDPVFDFTIPGKAQANATAADFIFKGLENTLRATPPRGPGTPANALLATSSNFQALSTQGVSIGVLNFGANGGEIKSHYHPRASEAFLVISGVVDVGLIDTNQKVYRNTMQPGDVTVFPRAMAHFQINRGNRSALGVSAFNSANLGIVFLGKSEQALEH